MPRRQLRRVLVEQFTAALLDPPSWVSRRVESLSYPESGETRRSVSIDFTLPSDYVVSDHAGTVVVPLAVLDKGPLTRLDVVDATGQAVSVLDTAANARWAGDAAVSYFAGQFALSVEQEQAIREIVAANPATCDGLIDGFMQTVPPSAGDLTWDFGVELLRWLGHGFVFVVELPDTVVGRRTIVKLSYETSSDPLLSWWRSLAKSVLPSTQVEITRPAVSEAASYHLELRPPASVSASELTVTRSSETPQTWSSGTRGPIAHVHVRDDSVGGSYEARAVLRPRRSGLVTYSWVAAALVTGLLALVMGFPSQVAERLLDPSIGPASAANLLVVPAFLLALLARPLEHPIASRVYFPARLSTALTAAVLMLMASAAVLRPDAEHVQDWAEWLFLIQLLVAAYGTLLMSESDPRRNVSGTG